MTNDELAAIKARCDRVANPINLDVTFEQDEYGVGVSVWGSLDAGVSRDLDKRHLEFVKKSFTDIPRLLSHIQAQAARIKALEKRIQWETQERRSRP